MNNKDQLSISMLTISLLTFTLFIGSAIITLLLLPFGYNFTDKWLYLIASCFVFFLIVYTIYNCWAWWRYRNTERAPATSHLLSCIFFSITIITFATDLFPSFELKEAFGYLCLYLAIWLSCYSDNHLRPYIIPIGLFYIFLYSMNLIPLFRNELQISREMLSSVRYSNSFLNLINLVMINLVFSFVRSKEKKTIDNRDSKTPVNNLPAQSFLDQLLETPPKK